MIQFFVPVNPPTVTHHSKVIIQKGGHASLRDSDALVCTRELLEALFVKYRPKNPIVGPVALYINYTFPYLKKHSQKARKMGMMRKTTKPDSDNMAKVATDVLVRLGFLVNDSQICELHVYKWHGRLPGIDVCIEEVPLCSRQTESHEN